MTKDLRAAAEEAMRILTREVTVPGQFGREPIYPAAVAKLRTALAQPPSAEVQGLDSVRFEWWFSNEPKYEFFDQYMEGVSAGWSLDQWRTAIDAAMAADLKDTL